MRVAARSVGRRSSGVARVRLDRLGAIPGRRRKAGKKKTAENGLPLRNSDPGPWRLGPQELGRLDRDLTARDLLPVGHSHPDRRASVRLATGRVRAEVFHPNRRGNKVSRDRSRNSSGPSRRDPRHRGRRLTTLKSGARSGHRVYKLNRFKALNGQSGPRSTERVRIGPDHTGPHRVGLLRAGHLQTGPVRTGQARVSLPLTALAAHVRKARGHKVSAPVG